MKQKCIDAVSQALGRLITRAEADAIEARISRNMHALAAKDPGLFRAMPVAERMKQAAAMAAKELVQEAELKKRQVELQIRAQDRLENYITSQATKGMDGIEAVRRTLAFVSDGKSNILSAESRGNAIKANAVRQIIDTFEAVDPRFWGLFEDQEGVKALTRAIFGEATGNGKVDQGAKAWLEVAEQLRAQFEQAGGKINRLEGWNVPQHHSQLKVSRAGREQWVADMFPLLKREKYRGDDGRMMSDPELVAFLQEAWLSISTGGINDIKPGAQGQAMLANRRNVHREIHFKDADSYLEYQAQYGEKTLWGVMTGHVEALSKEIAMLEMYGPNPDRSFQLILDKQLQAQAVESPAQTAKASEAARKLSSLYDFVAGKTQPVVHEGMALRFDTLRNWLVASKLGSMVITAISDEATLHLTARVNKLPEMQLIQNELAALNIANRTEEHLARRAGLALDTMLGHLNRWGTDNLGNTWSNKMASTVIRASGNNALEGARRRAFGVTMLSALGEMAGKYRRLADIDKHDYRLLLSKGITEADWSIWRAAELEQWGAGNGVLTPEAIMRIPDEKIAALGVADAATAKRDAVLRLLGATLEETDMAIIRPGMIDRHRVGGGLERGTWKGELTRSVFLFKSFPIAMIARHWMRGMGMETAGGKAAYLSSLIVGTTVLGALSQTINDLLEGKNPRNYNPTEEHGVKHWIAAMMKGGSLGLYGDFLFSGVTSHQQTGPIAALLGPVAGVAEDAFKLTQGNLVKEASGKDGNFGSDLVKFIRGNLPGSNLWYAKAALDHMIFHQMQEYFAPGYLNKMEQRARKNMGQSYYWRPGAPVSQMNAPNLGVAFGN